MRRRTRSRVGTAAALACAAAVAAGCTAGSTTAARTRSLPATSPPTSVAITPPATAPTASASPATTAPTPTPARFGGASVRWPELHRDTTAPPALGAVDTLGRVDLAGGGTLAPGLTLPRVGGTVDRPSVLSPCGTTVTIVGGRTAPVAASTAGSPVVVVDPGHGGHNLGTHAHDGTPEKLRTLQVATLVARDLRAAGVRVVLTRTSDIDASLGFRAALADAVRARLAVSVHFNAAPETTLDRPGVTTYGSVADRHGRRAAGVVYQAERRYLMTLDARVGGTWAGNRDAGALYRLGSRGDYYALLRDGHVPWVISESMYLSDPREARLLADGAVRAGLAQAIADGVLTYLRTDDPGSGWRHPITRPADPAKPAGTYTCTDPS